MKKMIATLVAITLLWSYQPSTASYQPDKGKPPAFFYYTWYYDEDMEQPVGQEQTVNAEMERLRVVHPGFIFASSPSLGITAYEYGYFSFYPAAIIYSDLPYYLACNGDPATVGR